MNRGPRLALSALVALMLPFPGSHVDRWNPMVAMLHNPDAGHAPAAFFALTGVVLAAYTALVFGAISLLKYIVRRGSGGSRSN